MTTRFRPNAARLGRSLRWSLTPIGLGAWAIGGEWRFGWGPQDDADSIATIRRAVEHGLNWIDTAAIYGLGHSEEVVGAGAAGHTARRAPLRVHQVQPRVGRSTAIRRTASIRNRFAPEVEQSLRRLETEQIDLYQIHWPVWPASPQGHDPGSIEEAWTTLTKLQVREGRLHRRVKLRRRAAANVFPPIETPTNLQPPYSTVLAGDRAGHPAVLYRRTTSASFPTRQCNRVC